jgi:hypothetical protein
VVDGSSVKIHKLIAKVKVPGAISKNTTCACIAPGNTTKPQICAVPIVLWFATKSEVVKWFYAKKEGSWAVKVVAVY